MFLASTPRLAITRAPAPCRQPPRARPSARVSASAKGGDPAPHFETTPARGECLLEDARDAMEACAKKGLTPEQEAACFAQFGCDATSVHAALDSTNSDDGDKDDDE